MNDTNSITVNSAILTGTATSWTTDNAITWVCAACGTLVCGWQPHVCHNAFQTPQPQAKPHRCPVCEGRARVLFDPENPHHRGSSVQDWPCKPCNGSGIIWGF